MRNFIKIIPLFVLFYSCSSGDIHFNKANSQFKNDLDESWIVINYWADWCPPCLKEMPELVTFAQSNPDIKVFAYNFDRLEPEYLDPLILRFGVDIPSITSHLATKTFLPIEAVLVRDGFLISNFSRIGFLKLLEMIICLMTLI